MLFAGKTARVARCGRATAVKDCVSSEEAYGLTSDGVFMPGFVIHGRQFRFSVNFRRAAFGAVKAIGKPPAPTPVTP